MSVYVFTGPTISAAEARLELEAVYLPPAAEGDVYRLSLKGAEAIGIIDGYFQSTPPVRHKEILWAMTCGIHVFGSASMGALRAAELAAFGMEGVGIVFELFRDGVLEDDDEVTVVHAPPEVGFLPGSEAMVNIRQTLRKAEHAGVITAESRATLEKIAKGLFYPERNYPALLRVAWERGLPGVDLAQFQRWLSDGRVNQKRDDAVAMLRLMRQRLAEGLKPKTVRYSFEHTAMWETTRWQGSDLRFDSNLKPNVVYFESLLNELRLEGDTYNQHQLLALERFFALREARRIDPIVSEARRVGTESAFRKERDLLDERRLERWQADNGLSVSEFNALILDEARVACLHQRAQHISTSCLLEHLRLSGDYPRLRSRALGKQRLLEANGLEHPSLAAAKLTRDELLHWYFKEVLGRAIPGDPEGYAWKLGFASPEAFQRVLLKEYFYRWLRDRDSHAGTAIA
jgi:hypothetical protein